MKFGDEVAFPAKVSVNSDGEITEFQFANNGFSTTGMSLRDYFAAHAPEPTKSWHGGDRSVDDVIAWRWHYANEMLKARGAI